MHDIYKQKCLVKSIKAIKALKQLKRIWLTIGFNERL